MDSSFELDLVQDFLQSEQQPADMEAAAIPAIKIEEHLAPSTITPDLLSLASPEPTTASSFSKQPKKRKSWGQVLPEPKTTLPPRKRAKTADEKEQRRIERVKRNRLAAHNSRERKREEMDKLSIINDGLVAQMNAMRDQMIAMQKEIIALRSGSSSASIPTTVNSFDFSIKQEPYQQQIPSSIISPPMTATTSLQATPELGNLDSPELENLGDEFPATPMEDAFGGEDSLSFTEVSLMPQLFQSIPVAKPQQQQQQQQLPTTAGADGNLHNQPSAFPLSDLDSFFDFENHEVAAKAPSNTFAPADNYIDITSPASYDDLLDEGASESSHFLNFIAADQGAPAEGSDGSGGAVEEGTTYAQLFADTITM